MTIEEFSDGFDTLLNSYYYTAGFGQDFNKSTVALDEYEKSVFLTKAQEDLVKAYYEGTVSSNEAGFEGSESIRRALDVLVRTASPEVSGDDGIADGSSLFVLPDDLWYIVYESATVTPDPYGCGDSRTLEVVPVRHDNWNRTKRNPFKQPNGKRVIRLDAGEGRVELVSSGTVTAYNIRYLRKPRPIILVPLTGSLSIDGEQDVSECELSSTLHKPILDRAVQLAATRLPSKQS